MFMVRVRVMVRIMIGVRVRVSVRLRVAGAQRSEKPAPCRRCGVDNNDAAAVCAWLGHVVGCVRHGLSSCTMRMSKASASRDWRSVRSFPPPKTALRHCWKWKLNTMHDGFVQSQHA